MVPSEYNPTNDSDISVSSSPSSGKILEETDSEGGNTAAWLIPLIGTLVVGLINQWQENQRANQQQEFSLEMYNKQVADNLNLWNLNNAYNSAAAQKQRLSEAGMSSLFYGLQNGQSPAEGGQPLGYERADLPFENPLLQASQISNIQADTAKKAEERLNLVKERDQMQANIDKAKAEINELTTRADLNAKQKERLEKDILWYERIQESLINYQGSAAKLNNEQANRIKILLPYEEVIHIKNIEEFEKKWDMWKAQARKDNALADLSEKDLEYYMWNHMQNGIFGSGISMINFLRMLIKADEGFKIPEGFNEQPNSVPLPYGDGYGGNSPYPPLMH